MDVPGQENKVCTKSGKRRSMVDERSREEAWEMGDHGRLEEQGRGLGNGGVWWFKEQRGGLGNGGAWWV